MVELLDGIKWRVPVTVAVNDVEKGLRQGVQWLGSLSQQGLVVEFGYLAW